MRKFLRRLPPRDLWAYVLLNWRVLPWNRRQRP